MSEFRRVTSGLQTEMRDAISEFEREVAVDEAPPSYTPPAAPPTPAPTPTPADAPATSAPSPPSMPTAPTTPPVPPPPAESTWVFPDAPREQTVSSDGEAMSQAARPESES